MHLWICLGSPLTGSPPLWMYLRVGILGATLGHSKHYSCANAILRSRRSMNEWRIFQWMKNFSFKRPKGSSVFLASYATPMQPVLNFASLYDVTFSFQNWPRSACFLKLLFFFFFSFCTASFWNSLNLVLLGNVSRGSFVQCSFSCCWASFCTRSVFLSSCISGSNL